MMRRLFTGDVSSMSHVTAVQLPVTRPPPTSDADTSSDGEEFADSVTDAYNFTVRL